MDNQLLFIVFEGPSKLPEMGKGLGKTMKSFQVAAKVLLRSVSYMMPECCFMHSLLRWNSRVCCKTGREIHTSWERKICTARETKISFGCTGI